MCNQLVLCDWLRDCSRTRILLVFNLDSVPSPVMYLCTSHIYGVSCLSLFSFSLFVLQTFVLLAINPSLALSLDSSPASGHVSSKPSD
jgi:hypothetical protein